MNRTQDVKGNPVDIDTLVEGFVGHTRKVAKARVTMVSPWGWVTGYDPENKRQVVFEARRYLVRDDPRPIKDRGDVPERLVHS